MSDGFIQVKVSTVWSVHTSSNTLRRGQVFEGREPLYLAQLYFSNVGSSFTSVSRMTTTENMWLYQKKQMKAYRTL